MHIARRIVSFSIYVSMICCAFLATSVARAQTMKAPPRTIADITAILDQEKPDPAKIANLKAQTEATPPAGANAVALANFHFERGRAMSLIGRTNDSIEELNKALEIARKNSDDSGYRISFLLAYQYRTRGDHTQALQLYERILQDYTGPGRMGRRFGLFRQSLITLVYLGELERAERMIGQAYALYESSQKWPNVEIYRPGWLATIEEMRARIADARGRYIEAERSYNKSRKQWEGALAATRSAPNSPPIEGFLLNLDFLLAFESRTKLYQGKLVEAEADMRAALLNRLKANGKYHADSAVFVCMFARTMQEQGRYQEAEKLQRTCIEIYQSLGYGDDNPVIISALEQLAGVFASQRRHEDVLKTFEVIDKGISNWDPKRAERFRLSGFRVLALYSQGKAQEAVPLAKVLFENGRRRYGDKSPIAAMSQGVYAIGLFAIGDKKRGAG